MDKNILEKRVEKKLLYTMFMVALILYGLVVSACFNPADPYAIEVVLNKPGIKYNLEKLAGIEGVSKVSYISSAYSAYAYRSHYDSRLIVVVSEQGLKYVSAQASSNKPLTMVSVKGLNITLEQLANKIEEARDRLEWTIDVVKPLDEKSRSYIFTRHVGSAEVRVFINIIVSTSGGKEATISLGLLVRDIDEVSDELANEIKAEISRLLEEIGLPQLGELLKVGMVKDSMVREMLYLAVRIQIPLKEEVTTRTVYVCTIEYSSEKLNVSELKVKEAEKLGWNIWVKKIPEDSYLEFMLTKKIATASLSVEGKGRGNTVYLSLKVINVDKLSNDVLDEFREVFESIGLSGDFVSRDNFEKIEESTGSRLVPALNISEGDVKNALRTELKWLLQQGVIEGLGEEDIDAIVSASRLGYSGWNSRLVWFSGKWVPYSSMKGAMVLKCIGVPPSFFLQGGGQGLSTPEGKQEWQVSSGESYSFSTIYLIIIYVLASVILAGVVAAVSYILVRKKIPVEK